MDFSLADTTIQNENIPRDTPQVMLSWTRGLFGLRVYTPNHATFGCKHYDLGDLSNFRKVSRTKASNDILFVRPDYTLKGY